MPVFTPEWFLCCQQKQSVFIMQFASRPKHGSTAWIWAKHPETILSALVTEQNARSKVRAHQWVSTYRVGGSSWGTEIWSDAFTSRIRSVSAPVLPKRTARISSLQACNCTHRSGERQGGTGHCGGNPLHRKVCYVPSPAFRENTRSRMKFVCYVIFYLPNSSLTSANERWKNLVVLCSAF